jgi:hypothetical protein
MISARQASDFARNRILTQGALAGGLVEHLHRLLQRGCGDFLIAASDCFDRIFRCGANTSLDGPVALLALQALTMALLGRRMNWNMRHKQLYLTVRASPINTHALNGTVLIWAPVSEFESASV